MSIPAGKRRGHHSALARTPRGAHCLEETCEPVAFDEARTTCLSDSWKVGRAPGDKPEATSVYKDLLSPSVFVLDLTWIETPASCQSCRNQAAIKSYDRSWASL